MTSPTAKKLFLTRHAQAEHKSVLCFFLRMSKHRELTLTLVSLRIGPVSRKSLRFQEHLHYDRLLVRSLILWCSPGCPTHRIGKTTSSRPKQNDQRHLSTDRPAPCQLLRGYTISLSGLILELTMGIDAPSARDHSAGLSRVEKAFRRGEQASYSPRHPTGGQRVSPVPHSILLGQVRAIS